MGLFANNHCPQCYHRVSPWDAPAAHTPKPTWVCRQCGSRLLRVPSRAGYARTLIGIAAAVFFTAALDDPMFEGAIVLGCGAFALVRGARWSRARYGVSYNDRDAVLSEEDDDAYMIPSTRIITPNRNSGDASAPQG